MAGYGWLFFSMYSDHHLFGGCLVKHVTHIPCPSCGSTHSILSLLQGNIAESLYWNPMGWVVLAFMVVIPVWLAADICTRKEGLYHAYRRTERWLQKKSVAIPLILLVIANWIWNIAKGV